MENENQQEVDNYVKQHLSKGFTKHQISISLQQAGWSGSTIKKAFRDQPSVQHQIRTKLGKNHPKYWKHNNPIDATVICGLGAGVALAIIFRLILPTPTSQFTQQFNNVSQNSIIPNIAISILVTLIILGVIYGWLLKFVVKYSEPFWTAFFVLFFGVFLAITVLDETILGNSFVFSLPITCLVGQLGANYISHQKWFKLVFFVIILILFIISLRILEAPKLPA